MELDAQRRLRKKRNVAIVVAVAVLAGSISISLPRRLARFHEQKLANEEILRLQAGIVAAQGQIRAVQAEILKVQAEISGPSAPR